MSKQPDVKTFGQWVDDNVQDIKESLIKEFVKGKLSKMVLNKYRIRKTNKKVIKATNKKSPKLTFTDPTAICPITSKPVLIKLAKVKIKLPIDNVECLIEPYNTATIINCLEACGIVEGIVKVALQDILEPGGKSIQEILAELLLNMSHPDIVKDIEYIFLGCDDDENLYFNVSCSADPEKFSDSVYKYS